MRFSQLPQLTLVSQSTLNLHSIYTQAQDRYLEALTLNVLGGAHTAVVSAPHGRACSGICTICNALQARVQGSVACNAQCRMHSHYVWHTRKCAYLGTHDTHKHSHWQVRMLQQADLFRDVRNYSVWARRVSFRCNTRLLLPVALTPCWFGWPVTLQRP